MLLEVNEYSASAKPGPPMVKVPEARRWYSWPPVSVVVDRTVLPSDGTVMVSSRTSAGGGVQGPVSQATAFLKRVLVSAGSVTLPKAMTFWVTVRRQVVGSWNASTTGVTDDVPESASRTSPVPVRLAASGSAA